MFVEMFVVSSILYYLYVNVHCRDGKEKTQSDMEREKTSERDSCSSLIFIFLAAPAQNDLL